MDQNKNLRKIKEYYDKRAIRGNAFQAAGQWYDEKETKEIVDEILKKINITKEQCVLEIGCGTGILGTEIHNNCKFYVGIDISFQMLKKFQTNNASHITPDLIQAITYSIPCDSNRFDVVVMNGVTMYLKNTDEVESTLKEIDRVIKQKGVIFLGENIVPKEYHWELAWFQKLDPFRKKLVLPYIKLRRFLARNPKLAGKWYSIHHEISPKLIRNHYKNYGIVTETDAVAQTVRRRKMGKNYNGNRRKDFVIRLK